MPRFFGFARTVSFLFLAALGWTLAQSQTESRWTEDTFKGLRLRGIGPALMSGRIADIAVHPRKKSVWYVAAGSGGVWKTVNAGARWTPLFDQQSSYSIGCLALDPSNPEVIWVGTGENVSGRHVGFGDGVYRSSDAGLTWKKMGLAHSEHISKILIDPRDSNVVFVAAEGPLWKAGGDRGVFVTRDGGQTWESVLSISENTGVTDLEFDPRNPDVLFAAAYQRRRHVWAFLAGGPESGIHKSSDSGRSWRRIENGLPKGDMGRIGLAVSPVNPDVVYATIEAQEDEAGFYRSLDSGESWKRRSDYHSGGTGPHYYQEIYASPHKLDRVYQMDVWLHFSEDGGKTFRELGASDKHSDNHAMAFDPDDPDHLLVGCDGGLYETWDHGASWRFIANLPLTQFYKLALDNDEPFYNIVGGTQDNNAQVGPSRTQSQHGIRNQDWYNTVSGDGYACQIDPQDPNIIYSEWQYGGLMRYDRRSRQLIDIQPQPDQGDPPERWNWDSPILISPHSHTRLYFGSQRIWRSDDRGDSWRPISLDLSRGRNRYEMPFMDRVHSVDALYDNGAMSWYGNTTSISESPVQEGLIYVGTDDGLVQLTENGGESWRRAAQPPGVPESSFVNEVKASVHDADVVFVAFDNHKVGDYKPYLMKSVDRGRSWTSISGDLPDRHLVWSVVQDHIDRDLLFAGTEYGIFFTRDGGRRWVKLSGGVPTIPFRDLEIQRRESDLVGASFGRGFYIFDDYSVLRHIDSETLDTEAGLFPVRKAWHYKPSVELGLRDKANLGSDHFIAPNPPFGAVFTYYLRDELKDRRQQRRDSEGELAKAGQDVPFPGWDVLKSEGRDSAPKLFLVVETAQGQVVRRIEAPSSAGFHRVAWDLRYPPFEPVDISPPRHLSPWESPPRGPMAPPGAYQVRLLRLDEGRLRQLGDGQRFQVEVLEQGMPLPADPSAVLAFQQGTAELGRQATALKALTEEMDNRLKHIFKAVVDTPGVEGELFSRVRELSERVAEVQERIAGDPVRRRLSEPSSPSIVDRIYTVVNGHWDTTQGPTQTHRRSLEIASTHLEVARRDVERLADDLRRLEQDLEQAGAPWTPGRRLPDR